MIKWISRITGAVALIALGLGWWLFVGLSKAPAAAPGLWISPHGGR